MNELHEIFRWNQKPKRLFTSHNHSSKRLKNEGWVCTLEKDACDWSRGHSRPRNQRCALPSIDTDALEIVVWVCLPWNRWSQGYILSHPQCGDRSLSSLISYFIRTKLLETLETLSGPEGCWWISRFVECFQLQLIISYYSESVAPYKFL